MSDHSDHEAELRRLLANQATVLEVAERAAALFILCPGPGSTGCCGDICAVCDGAGVLPSPKAEELATYTLNWAGGIRASGQLLVGFTTLARYLFGEEEA